MTPQQKADEMLRDEWARRDASPDEIPGDMWSEYHAVAARARMWTAIAEVVAGVLICLCLVGLLVIGMAM